MTSPAGELVETGVARVEILGVRVELTVPAAPIAEAVGAWLPTAARPVGPERPADALVRVTPHGRDRFVIVFDGALLHGPYPAGVVADLVAATVMDVVASEAPAHVLVRGAAVAVGGSAVVLVGDSFSGTTTLAAALVARGAAPLADGWVALDEAGAVTPTAGRREVGSAPVAVVASVPFAPRLGWQVERGAAVGGAMALLAQAPVARRDPARAMAVARAATAGGAVVIGRRGGAGEAAVHLAGLVTDP